MIFQNHQFGMSYWKELGYTGLLQPIRLKLLCKGDGLGVSTLHHVPASDRC